MERTGLVDKIGKDNIYPTDREALDSIYLKLGQPAI
jgi:hypothetical protein